MINGEITLRLGAVRGGDRAAFEELYTGLKIPVYTIIYRVTWDRAASEDILQEVFIKLFLSPPGEPVSNPRAYIFRMARNLAIDSVRKRDRHIPLDEIQEDAPPFGEAPPFDDSVSLRVDIEDALRRLPPDECEIVTLHIIGELKFREISGIMKIPLGTALWKYRKAVGKLQKMLSGGMD